MNKRKIMADLWIPITERRPTDPNKYIFCYNYKIKEAFVMKAGFLMYQLDQTQTKESFDKWKGQRDPHIFHTGYYVSHWMPVYPPDLPKDAEVELIRHCSICNLRQFPTDSGWSCANRHGGAPPTEDYLDGIDPEELERCTQKVTEPSTPRGSTGKSKSRRRNPPKPSKRNSSKSQKQSTKRKKNTKKRGLFPV